VRSLKQLVEESEWAQLKEFIEKANINENTLGVGTGGNINTLFKQSLKPLGKPLSYSYILEQYKKLKTLTVDQRILEYGFNPDRADVIVPALEIYLFVLKQAQIKNILVPKIGLADGLVKTLE
jgi:exopolyphosphatase/guanosine-5'-triphosphate,3'-diphosphate pyrophosphatase